MRRAVGAAFGAGLTAVMAALPGPAARAEDVTAASMTKAAKCRFGHYRFTSDSYEIPVGVITSADGWCWTAPRHYSTVGGNADGAGYPGEVSKPPEHGQVVVVEEAAGVNRYAYRPQPGYVGPDHFQLDFFGGGRGRQAHHVVLLVTVDVQKT